MKKTDILFGTIVLIGIVVLIGTTSATRIGGLGMPDGQGTFCDGTGHGMHGPGMMDHRMSEHENTTLTGEREHTCPHSSINEDGDGDDNDRAGMMGRPMMDMRA